MTSNPPPIQPSAKAIYIPTEFLQEIPKTDLHVHLDGSVRISTLIELAQQQGVPLPSYDENVLRTTVFTGRYDTLEQYLIGFKYTCAVMQNSESIERIAYEFGVDNYTEGVRYFEVRFAPQLHASIDLNHSFDIEQVISSVNKGLLRAKNEFNEMLQQKELELKQNKNYIPEPYYDYGIIVSAMRLFSPELSRYYHALLSIHPYIPYRRVASLASETLVRVAKKCRDELNIPVVALDVAGAENGFQNSVHKEAFDLAHSYFLNKTVHAGEAFGPESIKQAVRDLHAERIGHGYHLFSEELVVDEQNALDRAGYIRNLVKYVCDRRINVEVCLTSNLGTMPHLELKDHAIAKMLAHGVSVSLNTDNRLMSNTTMVEEIRKAVDTFNISPSQLKVLIMNGFKRSFYPGSYHDRRQYVRCVGKYYDYLVKKYHLEEDFTSWIIEE